MTNLAMLYFCVLNANTIHIRLKFLKPSNCTMDYYNTLRFYSFYKLTIEYNSKDYKYYYFVIPCEVVFIQPPQSFLFILRASCGRHYYPIALLWLALTYCHKLVKSWTVVEVEPYSWVLKNQVNHVLGYLLFWHHEMDKRWTEISNSVLEREKKSRDHEESLTLRSQVGQALKPYRLRDLF